LLLSPPPHSRPPTPSNGAQRYNDIVAARPASAPPRLDVTLTQLHSAAGRVSAVEQEVADNLHRPESIKQEEFEQTLKFLKKYNAGVNSSDEDLSSSSSENDESEWNTVLRDGKPQIRRKLSLISRTSSSMNNKSIDHELSTQQLKDIKTAMSKMTKQQQEDYNRHLEKFKLKVTEPEKRPQSLSPVAGPSKHKGKTANWSERTILGVPREELDTEAQRKKLKEYECAHKKPVKDTSDTLRDESIEEQAAILADIKVQRAELEVERANLEAKKAKIKANLKLKKANKEASRRSKSITLPEPNIDCIVDDIMTPKTPLSKKQSSAIVKDTRATNATAQVADKSYIGTIFHKLDQVNKRSRRKSKRKDNPSSSEPSDSSESSSSDSSSTESDSSEDNNLSSSDTPSSSSSSSEHDQKKRKKRHSKRKSKKSRKERVKPIELCTYNGSANTTEFSRFAQEVLDFIKTGRVHKRHQIFMMLCYLTGKAYKLYEQKYAMNPSKHNICTFFRDLFNHCFPPDFRSTLRERLFRCTQGN
jgi:hypothetical protein